MATANDSLFATQPQSVDLNLPRSGGSIEVVDVDNDDEDEDDLLLSIPGDMDEEQPPLISVVRFFDSAGKQEGYK